MRWPRQPRDRGRIEKVLGYVVANLRCMRLDCPNYLDSKWFGLLLGADTLAHAEIKRSGWAGIG